jgi:hypothetical protein
MSHLYKADWDLCWYSQSDTGCRNSNCTWRHGKSSDGHYQNHQQNKGSFHRRDPREQSDAPFYPVQQRKYGRNEDQYLFHHPDICNVSGGIKEYEFRSKLLHNLISEHGHPVSSPMSESSSVKIPVLISSPSSMITSLGSDSDCDIFKNVLDVSAGELTKAQQANSKGFFEDVLTKLQTPIKQLKMKSYPSKKSESALSPFAKVFVPSVEKLTLRESSAVAGEIKHRNRSMITTQQLPNNNSGPILIGKVYE